MCDKELVERYLAGDESAFAEIHGTYSWKVKAKIIETMGAGNPGVDDAISNFWMLMIGPEGYLARWDSGKCTLQAHLKNNASALTKNFIRDEQRSRTKELSGQLLSSDQMGSGLASDDDGYSVSEVVDNRGYGCISDGNFRGTAKTPIMQNHDLADELIAEEEAEQLYECIAGLKGKYVEPILELIEDGYEHGCLKAKAEEHGLDYTNFRQVWLRLEQRVAGVLDAKPTTKRLSQVEMEELVQQRFERRCKQIDKRHERMKGVAK